MSLAEGQALIKDWSQSQRLDTLTALLQMFTEVGAGPLPVHGERVGFLPLYHHSVAPGAAAVIQNNVQRHFRPRRLVIFEVATERPISEITHVEARIEPRGRLWWKKNVLVQAGGSTTNTRYETVVTPRGTWMIEGSFVGNKSQVFVAYGALSGDSFGPGEPYLPFEGDDCPPGLAITLQVRNTAARPLPFYAAVIGEIVQQKAQAQPLEAGA